MFLFLQNQIDEVRRSRQGRDAADREFCRSRNGTRQRVCHQQEKGAEEERVSEQSSVVAAEKQSRHMRHNQPDEANGTAEGYHHGNQYGGSDEHDISCFLRVNA